jgi:hypothetical protein
MAQLSRDELIPFVQGGLIFKGSVTRRSAVRFTRTRRYKLLPGRRFEVRDRPSLTFNCGSKEKCKETFPGEATEFAHPVQDVVRGHLHPRPSLPEVLWVGEDLESASDVTQSVSHLVKQTTVVAATSRVKIRR